MYPLGIVNEPAVVVCVDTVILTIALGALADRVTYPILFAWEATEFLNAALSINDSLATMFR